MNLLPFIIFVAILASGTACSAKGGLLDLKGHLILPREYDNIQCVAPNRYIGYSGRTENTFSFDRSIRYSSAMKLFDQNGCELAFTDDLLEKADLITPPTNLPAGVWLSDEKCGHLLQIHNNQGKGLCDRLGQIKIPCIYREINSVGESKFVAIKVDAAEKHESLLLDTNGNVITTLALDSNVVAGKFHEGLLKIGSATFVNERGVLVIPPGRYEDSYEFSDGLCAVTFSSNGKKCSGFVDVTGKLALGPFDGLQLFTFKNGLALVRLEKTGKLGAMNKFGEFVVPMEFDELGIGSKVNIFGKRDGRYLTMTKEGRIVSDLPSKLEGNDVSYEFSENENYRPFSMDVGYAFTSMLPTSSEKKTLWGVVAKDGKVLVKPKFGYVSAFKGDYACAYRKSGNRKQFGIIDSKGRWLIAPNAKYSRTYMLSEDRIFSGTGYIDPNMKPVEKIWKELNKKNESLTSERLIALTLEHYNLIGMRLSSIARLIGQGIKNDTPLVGPRGICATRSFQIPVGCLGSASLELGFDAKHRLVGWQIRHGETQDNWIFENVVSLIPNDTSRSDIGLLIPKSQRSILRKRYAVN